MDRASAVAGAQHLMAEAVYVDRAPGAELAGEVHSIIGFSEHTEGTVARREVAQQVVTIVLNLGPALQVGGRDEEMRPRGSFVAPMNGHYGLTEFSGRSTGIELNLSPAFAHRLLGVPMSELDAVVTPLEDVGGRWSLELVDRVGSEPSWDAKLEIVEAELARRTRDAPATGPDVAYAWRRLLTSGGSVRASTIASELGCSGRHLARRFSEQVGMGPKSSARVIRFRRALRLLSTAAPERFADVAGSCGYADQPHMNRDFRHFAGCPPGDLLASRMSDIPGFAAAAA